MTMSDLVKTPTFDLTLSRTIDATAEDVFDAWTDPDLFGRWFGVSRLIMNPVVDGLYFMETPFEGRQWPHYGRFVTIDRPRRLELTWVSEGTRGRESILTIALAPRDRRTELTLTHSGLPDDELGRSHEEGWKQILAEVAGWVESGKKKPAAAKR